MQQSLLFPLKTNINEKALGKYLAFVEYGVHCVCSFHYSGALAVLENSVREDIKIMNNFCHYPIHQYEYYTAIGECIRKAMIKSYTQTHSFKAPTICFFLTSYKHYYCKKNACFMMVINILQKKHKLKKTDESYSCKLLILL